MIQLNETHARRILDIAGVKSPLKSIEHLPGGSFRAYALITDAQRYFVKISDRHDSEAYFKAESQGLQALRTRSGCFKVPKVIATGKDWLVTEFVNGRPKTAKGEQRAGAALAKTHRNINVFFGWENNNYIGPLPQINTPCEEWSSFFVEKRIKPMLKSAGRKVGHETSRTLLKLIERMPQRIPDFEPSLLHGDFWSGNLMYDEAENPVTFDPAVYYGCREMDLAMTYMFGGFGPAFYKSYHENFPLEQGWQERILLWNVYPLLVHVNLFGRAYVDALNDSISQLARGLLKD